MDRTILRLGTIINNNSDGVLQAAYQYCNNGKNRISRYNLVRGLDQTRQFASVSSESEDHQSQKKLVWTVGKNPIVEQLWSMRHEAKKRLSDSASNGIVQDKGVIERNPQHSETKIEYPFENTLPPVFEFHFQI